MEETQIEAIVQSGMVLSALRKRLNEKLMMLWSYFSFRRGWEKEDGFTLEIDKRRTLRTRSTYVRLDRRHRNETEVL